MLPFDNATCVDLRHLALTAQRSLLEKAFEWLKVGQTMEVRVDGEAGTLRHALQSRHPGQVEWTAQGDRVVARRTRPRAPAAGAQSRQDASLHCPDFASASGQRLRDAEPAA